MTDESVKITDPDNAPVVFVSDVAGSGFLNGVVNLTLVVARWTPGSEGKVDPDFAIASRLRMDMFCAHRLRDQLDDIIKKNARPPSSADKPN